MHPRRADGAGRATRWLRIGGFVVGAGLGSPAVPVALSGAEPRTDPAVEPSVAEQVFFGRLHELVQAGKWEEATRHIRQLQALRNEPEWLAPRAGELRFAQIQISRGRNDPTGVLNAARLFLNGDESRSQRLLILAQQMYAADEKTSALSLVREITGRTPDFAPAQRVLAAWEPKPEPKPVPERKVASVAIPAVKPVATGMVPKAPTERTTVPATEEAEAASSLALLRQSHELGNIPGVVAAARLYLTGDRERADRMLEIAREFKAKDEPRLALMLTQEVLRRTPRYGPARRQLAEFEAAAPKP